MKSEFIETSINQYLRQYSGLDQKRDYLGISKVAQCPKAVILEYRNGVDVESEFAHRTCYMGYEQEAETMKMLLGSSVAKELNNNEVVAPFDSRLRGHVDGETVEGELLEIKSVSTKKFGDVTKSGMAKYAHFIQVQLYMRYGPWKSAFVVYRCRETYEHKVIHIPYHEAQAVKFENQARALLKHIDDGTLPECECGRHSGRWSGKKVER